jgi:molecular chaperone GrpE
MMGEDMNNDVKEHEIDAVDESEIKAIEEEFDADKLARFETIRQMALAGELEYSPESEEIVEALIETIGQRDENFGRYQEMAAEHRNFQRRASMNENEARISSRQGVVQALIPLMDHFEMALLQDPEKVSAKDVISGVEMIRGEFLRMLSGYGVSAIEPKVGDEFDPEKHAAMMQQAVDGVEPGCISLLMGVGYMLGDRVIRPAKVGVAPEAVEKEED